MDPRTQAADPTIMGGFGGRFVSVALLVGFGGYDS